MAWDPTVSPTAQSVTVPGTETSREITGLTPGVEYAVAVVSVVGTSESAVGQAQIDTPHFMQLATPVNLRAEPSDTVDGRIEVEWEPVTNAERYVVGWKIGEQDWDAERQVVVEGGSVVTRNLVFPVGDVVDIRVQARRTDGLAADSNWTTPTRQTAFNVNPAQPSGLAAATSTTEGGAIDVSWEAAARADAYEVRWVRVGLSVYSTATTTETSYTIEGLGEGAAYQQSIEVRATRAGAQTPSNWAGPVNAIPSISAPGIPSGLTVRQTPGRGDRLIVSWSAGANATSYVIERRIQGQTAVTTSTRTGTTLTAMSLAIGTTYEFRVKAVRTGSIGDSAWTPWVAGQAGLPAPGAPTELAVSASSTVAGRADLTWKAAANATGYVWERRISGQTPVVTGTVPSGTTTTLAVTGLMGGTTYEWRMKSTRAQGVADSGWTPWVSATIGLPAPGVPTGFTATPSSTEASRIDLSWTAGANATSYAWERRVQGRTAVTSGTVTGLMLVEYLTEGTTYEWRIKSIRTDAVEDSAWTAWVSARAPRSLTAGIYYLARSQLHRFSLPAARSPRPGAGLVRVPVSAVITYTGLENGTITWAGSRLIAIGAGADATADELVEIAFEGGTTVLGSIPEGDWTGMAWLSPRLYALRALDAQVATGQAQVDLYSFAVGPSSVTAIRIGTLTRAGLRSAWRGLASDGTNLFSLSGATLIQFSTAGVIASARDTGMPSGSFTDPTRNLVRSGSFFYATAPHYGSVAGFLGRGDELYRIDPATGLATNLNYAFAPGLGRTLAPYGLTAVPAVLS